MFFASGSVMAAGPLVTTDDANPQPYKWDTSAGSIPVYVDGGANNVGGALLPYEKPLMRTPAKVAAKKKADAESKK